MQLIIDHDITMLIDRNAGLIQPQVIGIGATSYCEQKVGAANLTTCPEFCFFICGTTCCVMKK